MSYIKKSTSSLMPRTFCLVDMNPVILKFNWEFYVTCRWQEAYYSHCNTCRPRSSSIRPCTWNKRAVWFACIMQHFYVKSIVKMWQFLQKKMICYIFNCIAGYDPYIVQVFTVRHLLVWVFYWSSAAFSIAVRNGYSWSMNINVVLNFEQFTCDIKSPLF